MIDMHCHLLPGVDDGPPTMSDALEQARVHVAAGVSTVICTPHVNHSYANTSESISVATAQLQSELDAAGVALRLLPGAEVSLSRAIALPDEELSGLHLGSSDWLLVEPPLGSDVPRLEQLLSGLQSRGHRVLVAHPERCAAFHHDADLLGRVVATGARAQITAASFTGQFGRTVEGLARKMLGAGLVHVVASDAHDAHHRAPGLAQPLENSGLSGLTDWACEQVPSALLRGVEPPAAPAVRSHAKRSLFRRR